LSTICKYLIDDFFQTVSKVRRERRRGGMRRVVVVVRGCRRRTGYSTSFSRAAREWTKSR
jgi:hypothetical protein